MDNDLDLKDALNEIFYNEKKDINDILYRQSKLPEGKMAILNGTKTTSSYQDGFGYDSNGDNYNEDEIDYNNFFEQQ